LPQTPLAGAYSAPPDPLAGFGGHFAGGGAGLGKRRERGREREGREVEGRGREGPQVTVELGPLRALLRHW